MRFLVLLVVTLVACSSDHAPKKPRKTKSAQLANDNQPQLDLPRGKVILSPEGQPELTVRVQIASTREQRRKGLMFREKLAEDEGMLFLFRAPEQQSFWMQNTLLPLDIIFIKSDMTVLGVVEGATPLTEDPREVPGESQYVLEVNATYAKRHGIQAGTRVRFEGTEGLSVQ